MADIYISEIISAHPIGSSLDAFRSTVPPLPERQLAWADEHNAALRDACLNLVLTLQMLPASRLLPSSGDGRNLFSDLSQLSQALNSGKAQISRFIPLLEAIRDKSDDETVWAQVYELERNSALHLPQMETISKENPVQLHIVSTAATGSDDIAIKSSTKRTRLPKSSIKILKRWCEDHWQDPYPTSEEKDNLMCSTGLSSSQLSSWFVNARRRGKIRPQGATDCVAEVSSSTPNSNSIATANGWEMMNPLDRWRHSPPEDEAASLSSISRAVAQSEPTLCANGLAEYPPVRSVSSFDWSQSSSSATSNNSSHYNLSGDSLDGLGGHRQRRRRQKRKATRSQLPRGGATDRPYQCTFCTDSFKTKFDWARHEKTLHLSLETWTCARFGPIETDAIHSRVVCAFCGIEDPSTKHLESHGYEDCRNKSIAARTFYRKDHLRQHLRLVHSVEKFIPSMLKWKSEIKHVKSRCGLCDARFLEWSERNDHLASHFLAGAHMKDWNGCRGFEPVIALLVQNAMPPYLIGADTTAVVPFSATRFSRETNGLARQPTTFESLTERLGQFVRLARETGVIITDELLQQEARCIVYEDDDPWNQTAADNPQWLNLFKQGHGLEPMDSLPQEWVTTKSAGPAMDTPWTTEDWMNPAVQSTMLDGAGGFDQYKTAPVLPNHVNLMPYAWQSPECLAEFRERNVSERARGHFEMSTIIPPDGSVRLSAESVLGRFQCFEPGTCNNSSPFGQISNSNLPRHQSSTHNAEADVQCPLPDNSLLGLGTSTDRNAPTETLYFGEMESNLDVFTSAAFEY